MNDPKDQPVDIADQKAWLADYRARTGMSWSELSKKTGIASGTLSQFGSAKGYGGDEQRIADQIFRFRQQLNAQAHLKMDAPELPGFFASPTARDIEGVLAYGQRGRMVVIATGAGMGKTTTIRHYQACNATVWVATMSPSSAGIMTMQQQVLNALGERDVTGPPNKLTQLILDKVRASGGLLVIDEAQHLQERALEEIRSWQDQCGVGVALAGNLSVIQRLEGGTRRAHLAQLFSRVGMRLVRAAALDGDADALCNAWDISDEAVIRAMREICKKPGGLRGGTFVLELAHMLASREGTPVDAALVRDCWAQLSTRPVAA
jgi:DNA transposition AAA+ family ATPase